MAFELLKYEAGTPKKEKTGGTAGQTQAVITSMQKAVQRGMHHQEAVSDRESKKRAMTDIVQNRINPNRDKRDLAYEVTIQSSMLSKTNAEISAELENPQSELSQMKPDEFAKYLQGQTEEFYKVNSEHPHGEQLAEQFSMYTLQNQPKIIGAHASQYKKTQYVNQLQAGTLSLVDTASRASYDGMSKEQTDLGIAMQIEKMFPADMIKPLDRTQAIFTAAYARAQEGDVTLLNFAQEFYDMDVQDPRTWNAALKAEQDHTRASEQAYYDDNYVKREEMSRLGTYSTWKQDMLNPEMVRRWGRGTINRWWAGNQRTLNGQNRAREGSDLFRRGGTMIGYTADEFTGISQAEYQEAISEKNPQTRLQNLDVYFERLAKQPQIDASLKQSFATQMGTGTYTVEDVKSPAFQDHMVMAGLMLQHMQPDQAISQMGDAAYENYRLHKSLDQKYGDPDKTAEAMAMIAKRRQDGDIPQYGKGREFRENITAAVGKLYTGGYESSDKALSKWLGVFSDPASPLMQGGIQAQLEKNIDLLMKETGVDINTALEIEASKLAGKVKKFGNSLHFAPGGAQQKFGFATGTTQAEMDVAWERYAQSINENPDDLVMGAAVGDQVQIMHKKTGEHVTMPAVFIGAQYQMWKDQEDEFNTAKTAALELIRQDTLNRDWIKKLAYNTQWVTDPNAQYPAGTNEEVLLRMQTEDPARLSALRADWKNKQWGKLKKLVNTFTRGVQTMHKKAAVHSERHTMKQ